MQVNRKISKSAAPLLAFPLAGMAAALLTICVPMMPVLSEINVLGSLFFGVAMVLCLRIFYGLRSIRKIIIFLLGSFVAAVAGMLSSMYVSGRVFEPAPWDRPMSAPIAFTGGFVGAFVLMAAAISCFADKSLRVLIQSAGWALAGGVFAALGSASADWFEHIRSQLRTFGPGRPLNGLNTWSGEELALVIIWQTGMGLVIALALALWMAKKSFASEAGNSPAASQPSR